MFKITNHLMHRKQISNLPTDMPADAFSAYFIGKIDQIRDDLASNRADPAPPSLSSSRPSPSPTLTTLNPASEQEIVKIIQSSSPKSCQLDPLPTVLVKNLKTTLAVPITRLINMSLATGEIPDSSKTALITPVIKNESLDSTEKKNYRPISNLSFVSKVAEKVVTARLNSHLEEGKLLESQQSAYKKFHSVETALLKVHNDIMCAVDSKRAAMLVLLDLSSAFDTIDHDVLIYRLSNNFGNSGNSSKLVSIIPYKSSSNGQNTRGVVIGGFVKIRSPSGLCTWPCVIHPLHIPTWSNRTPA